MSNPQEYPLQAPQQNHHRPNKISIGWTNLRYEALDLSRITFHSSKNKIVKPILRRLNGHFEYHSLNGLMGPSGAGKTTLLNTLSGNLTSGLTSDSNIYVNNSHEKSSSIVSFFIEQYVHETIAARLTVSQILLYAFRIKNGGACGRSRPAMTVMVQIESVLRQLLLPNSILDNCFGECSGGEQKRIAIAQELMSLEKPSLLFVDEPTTGLDSAAAFEVISCLQQLTNRHRITVIASIHAPNHETLCLFDKLYVLARGGVCIYSGSPNQIQPYLERHLQIVIHSEQPIETLIKIACNGEHDPSVVTLANQILRSEFDQISSQSDSLKRLPYGLPNDKKQFSLCNLLVNIARQMQITFQANFRLFVYQILFYLFINAILSTLFQHDMVLPDGCYVVDSDSKVNSKNCLTNHLNENSLLNENITYHCYLFAFVGFICVSTSSTLFSSVVRVFQNEHRNRWYSIGVFYLSLTFVSLIEQSILSLFNATFAYFSTGQHAIDNYSINWIRFGHYLTAVWLNTVYIQSIGQLIGALIPDQLIGIVVSTMSYTVIAIQNDYFYKTDKLANSVLQTELANLIGLKYLTRYVIYIFYGIDRCNDGEGEVSLVMSEHLVDPEKIWFYIQRILVNVAVVRIVTFLCLYIRFNKNIFNVLNRIFIPNGTRSVKNEDGCIPIDYSPKTQEKRLSKMCELTLGLAQTVIMQNDDESFRFEGEDLVRDKISVAWRNLSLVGSSSIFEIGSTPSESASRKLILSNLSGHFCFGTLNALMGTSGAGKTTLLRTLNGQLKTRLTSGTRLYLSKYVQIQTCFITQEVSAHLLPGLTAKQMLVYASRLKNQTDNSKVQHEQIALTLLKKLGLNGTADTKVDKCSGGERKRLALAVELTSAQMPNLICIDEPTSGLDSNSAEIIISCLRKLTQDHPITIIASIHQPNSEVLQMFDKLYILARGGVCVYSGIPSEISFHISNVAPEIASQTDEPKLALESLIKHSCNGHQDPIVQQLVQQTNHQQVNENYHQNDTKLSSNGIPLNRKRFSLKSFYILTLRYMTIVRGHLWAEWLVFSAVYLCYGGVLLLNWDPQIANFTGCFSLDDDFNNTCTLSDEKVHEQEQLSASAKYSYFMSSMFVLITMIQSTMVMNRELVYFVNEHRNGWYTTGSFYLLRIVFDLVPMIPVILVYVYIVNIYEPVRPGIYWHLVFLLIISLLTTQGMCHIFVLIGRQNIILITMLLLGTFNLYQVLSNFFISIHRVHYLYRFVSNFVVSRHTIECVMLLEYGFERCAPKQLSPILYLMSLRDEDYYWSVGMILFNMFIYRLVAIGLLVSKVNPIENRFQRVYRLREYQNKIVNSKKQLCTDLGPSNYEFCIRKLDP